ILKMKKPTLAMRIKQNMCEWCGKSETDVLVHQVRNLKDLKCENEWEIFMKQINRKTLAVCKDCFKMMTM
ncbi:MAG: group II intron reverse transcriptase/maturase, partial [Lachnospiraceae bacterium]|nr:group II intron reverse transcriptase/maturase [Lachnospiraceae bacterium]MCM1235355.1 group II intron reverse transcriptase/maturase [Ruminococcus flavefaciens]